MLCTHRKGARVPEVSHLRCFVAVAEELHFGRAAERLNMTQPPLSRQIQLLERELRCELFFRTSRNVELTKAGLAYLPEAQKILSLLDRASTLTRDTAAGRRGGARCGFTASTSYEFLPRLVQRLRFNLPDIRLHLQEMVSRAQVRGLRSGEIDLGLTRAPIDMSEFEHRLIGRERLMLALPQDHPLAREAALSWHDLHGRDFLMYEPREGQYFHDLVAGRLAIEGIHPRFLQHLSQIHSILALVRAGVGLAVVPASAAKLNMFGVAYREFNDPQPATAELMVVWRADNRNPVVPAIAEEARACAELWLHDLDDESLSAKSRMT